MTEKKPTTLLGHLEAWVQDETGAQFRMRDLLARQEKALKGHDADEMRAAVDAMEVELTSRDARERRRGEIFGAFARAWEISVGALTLRSIGERLGDHAQRLWRMRSDLESIAKDVQTRASRVAVLVRVNRSVINDVLEGLVGCQTGSSDDFRGRLLDAEA